MRATSRASPIWKPASCWAVEGHVVGVVHLVVDAGELASDVGVGR